MADSKKRRTDIKKKSTSFRSSIQSYFYYFIDFEDFISENNLYGVKPWKNQGVDSGIIVEYERFKKNNPNFQKVVGFSNKVVSWHNIFTKGDEELALPYKGKRLIRFSTKIKSSALGLLLERYFQMQMNEKSNRMGSVIPFGRVVQLEYISKLPNYSVAIWLCNMVSFLESHSRDGALLLENKISNEGQRVINAFDANVFDQILSSHKANPNKVVINSIEPLIGRLDFLQLVIENKISFQSETEPELSRKLSFSLNELSETRGFRKAGNPNAGKNAIEPANQFAEKIGPILEKMDSDGYKTYQAKADRLNEKGIKTLRGKDWERSTVRLTSQRWEKLKAEKDNNKKSSPSETPKP